MSLSIRTFAAALAVALATAAHAQDQGIIGKLDALGTQQVALAELFRAVLNPWEVSDKNLGALARRTGIAKGCPADLDRHEYAIRRNGGLRTLVFSEWNGGCRIMTSPYMTGDSDQANARNFHLGGSVWIVGTRDANDDTCTGDALWHYYYFATASGITVDGGNRCTTEGPVYSRKRWFGDDVEALVSGAAPGAR